MLTREQLTSEWVEAVVKSQSMACHCLAYHRLVYHRIVNHLLVFFDLADWTRGRLVLNFIYQGHGTKISKDDQALFCCG
jgi:hypothetical protein